MTSRQRFSIQVTEKSATVEQENAAKRSSNPMLAVVCLVGLAVGLPGAISAWPQSVAVLRQSGRAIQSTATIIDTRIVEVPHPDRDDLPTWRKEGLYEFQAQAVVHQFWIPMAEFFKRSEVVPGGAGALAPVWFDPETGTATSSPATRFDRCFILMFYVVLCLAGFSSGLVLLQRLRHRPRPESPTPMAQSETT